MCGIVGLVTPGRKPDRAVLERLTRTLRHRGPDDEGYHVGPDIGLGFRRLAIIDLETGNQPVANETGTIHAVFNGEIYNFRELRHRLAEAGHTFRSQGDAEVLPHLYEDVGPALVEQLRGMFAFALWDAEQRQLLLGRDRLGEKPMYYTTHAPGSAFAFASEMKALLAAGVSREPDRVAIAQYLYHLYVPAPRSAFAAISKLPPGHLLRVRDGRATLERYWTPTSRAVPRSEADHISGLRERVFDAVRSRLVADVPLGAFLSGGIDSAAVVAGMRRAHDGPVHTFTITFEGFAHYNEAADALASAKYFGTHHHELNADLQLDELLPRIVDSFDEPFGNATAALTWGLSAATREHVKVVLTGDGSDELFFGYPRYQGVQLADRYRRAPRWLRSVAASLSQAIPESTVGRHTGRRVREFLSAGALAPWDAYATWIGYFTPDLLEEVVVPDFRPAAAEARTFLDSLFASGRGVDLNEISCVELQSFLPYNVLEYADKMSMAHGLELRAPFVDHELVEYVATMPPTMKLRNRTSKWALREALGDDLPAHVRRGRKRGLNPPLGAWLADGAAPLIRELLDQHAVRRRGVIRPEAVETLLAEQDSRHRDRSLHIWALLVLELWFRRRVDAFAP